MPHNPAPMRVFFVAAALLCLCSVSDVYAKALRGTGSSATGVLATGEGMSMDKAAPTLHHVGTAGSDTDPHAVDTIGVAAPTDESAHATQGGHEASESHADGETAAHDAERADTREDVDGTQDGDVHGRAPAQTDGHAGAPHTSDAASTHGDASAGADDATSAGGAMEAALSHVSAIEEAELQVDIPLSAPGLSLNIKALAETSVALSGHAREIKGSVSPKVKWSVLDGLFTVHVGCVGRAKLASREHDSFGDMFLDLGTALAQHFAQDLESAADAVVTELRASIGATTLELPSDILERLAPAVAHVQRALDAAEAGRVDDAVAALDVPGLREASQLHKRDIPLEFTSNSLDALLALWSDVTHAQRTAFEHVLDAHGKRATLGRLAHELDALRGEDQEASAADSEAGHAHVFVMGVHNAAWTGDAEHAVSLRVQAQGGEGAVLSAAVDAEEQRGAGAYVPLFEDLSVAMYDRSSDAHLALTVRVQGAADAAVRVAVPSSADGVTVHTADLGGGATLHYATFFKALSVFDVLEHLTAAASNDDTPDDASAHVFEIEMQRGDTLFVTQDDAGAWSWRGESSLFHTAHFAPIPADPTARDEAFGALSAAERVLLVALARLVREPVTPSLLYQVQLARATEGLRTTSDGAALRMARDSMDAFRVAFGQLHRWKLDGSSDAQQLAIEALRGVSQLLQDRARWEGSEFRQLADRLVRAYQFRLNRLTDSIGSAVHELGVAVASAPGTPSRAMEVDAAFLVLAGVAGGADDFEAKGDLMAGVGVRGTLHAPFHVGGGDDVAFYTTGVAKLELSAHEVTVESILTLTAQDATRTGMLFVSVECPIHASASAEEAVRLANTYGPMLLDAGHTLEAIRTQGDDATVSQRVGDAVAHVQTLVESALTDVLETGSNYLKAAFVVHLREAASAEVELAITSDLGGAVSELFHLPGVDGYVRSGFKMMLGLGGGGEE